MSHLIQSPEKEPSPKDPNHAQSMGNLRKNLGSVFGKGGSAIDESGVKNLDNMDDEAFYEGLTGEKPDSPKDLDILKMGGEKKEEPEKRRSVAERMSKYPSKPQRELDLHGKKGDEAGRAIRLFVLESDRLNLRKVSIITGKGLHSEQGQSVLKNVAEEKLRELVKEKRVLSYEWGNRNKAHSGSVIVYIA